MKLKRRFQPRPRPVEGRGRALAVSAKDMPEKSSESAGECWFCRNDTRPSCFTRKKGVAKKKPFVPPIPTERAHRPTGWETSLTSVSSLLHL